MLDNQDYIRYINKNKLQEKSGTKRSKKKLKNAIEENNLCQKCQKKGRTENKINSVKQKNISQEGREKRSEIKYTKISYMKREDKDGKYKERKMHLTKSLEISKHKKTDREELKSNTKKYQNTNVLAITALFNRKNNANKNSNHKPEKLNKKYPKKSDVKVHNDANHKRSVEHNLCFKESASECVRNTSAKKKWKKLSKTDYSKINNACPTNISYTKKYVTKDERHSTSKILDSPETLIDESYRKCAIDVYETKSEVEIEKPLTAECCIKVFECPTTKENKSLVKPNSKAESYFSEERIYQTKQVSPSSPAKKNIQTIKQNQFKGSKKYTPVTITGYNINENKRKEKETTSRVHNRVNIESDIYENSLSETTPENIRYKNSHISLNLSNHNYICNKKKFKRNFRSISDSSLKSKRKKCKYNCRSRRCKNKCTFYNSLMELPLPKPNSQAVRHKKTIKKLRLKNPYTHHRSHLHSYSNQTIPEFLITLSNDEIKNPVQMGEDGNIFDIKKRFCGDFHSKRKVINSSEIFYTINLSTDDEKKMRKSENGGQWCFADPELYSCDSKVVLEDEQSIVTDPTNITKKQTKLEEGEKTISNETLYNGYNESSQISLNLSSKVSEKYKIEEEIIEYTNEKEYRESLIHIKTIQNEYNKSIETKKDNLNRNINNLRAQRVNINKNTDKSEGTEKAKFPKLDIPCQSTVTIVSGFGTKSRSKEKKESEQTLNILAAFESDKSNSTAIMKDAAVSAPNSWEILNKKKFMTDKGVMCTVKRCINKNKQDIKRKIKRNIHKTSKRTYDSLLGGQNGLKENEVGNLTYTETVDDIDYHHDIVENDTNVINIQKHKPLHSNNHNVEENRKQISPHLFNHEEEAPNGANMLPLNTKDGTYTKQELEDVKINFKENFNFVYDNECGDSKPQPKGIWNSLKNSSQRYLNFFWHSGSFKSCFKKSIFR